MEQTGALTFLKETLRLPYFFFILNVSAMEDIISIWVLVTLCWNNFRCQLLSIGWCVYNETLSHKIHCSTVSHSKNEKNKSIFIWRWTCQWCSPSYLTELGSGKKSDNCRLCSELRLLQSEASFNEKQPMTPRNTRDDRGFTLKTTLRYLCKIWQHLVYTFRNSNISNFSCHLT